MDFRTCPACQASVLEDDVQDCPFCGASMSGKPQPKKAPPAAKVPPAEQKKSAPAPAAQPGRPVPKRPAGPRRTDAPELEDPFEVDTSAVRRAVKLAPNPTKTRTYEVVCPMCETPGFCTPQDGGKDVHCANPKCIAPVFKAPRPKVEEAPKEAPRDLRPLIIGGALAALLVIGGLFWVLKPKQESMIVDDTPIEAPTVNKTELIKGNEIQKEVVAPPATIPEIRAQIASRITDKVKQRNSRSRAVGLQLAAETYAVNGQLDRANSQLSELQNTREGAAPYFQIPPLVEIGWKQLAAGNRDAADKSATTALARTKDLPKSVRKTHDAAASLAALLVALGRQEDALNLVRNEQDYGPRGQMSTLWRAAVDSKSFNLDEEARNPWHVVIPEPMRMAVVETLVSRGQVDLGLEFAATAENAASQDACRAAWAGRLVSRQKGEAISTVNAKLQGANFSTAAKIRAWAALAAAYLNQNDKASAQTALDRAIPLLSELNPGAPMAFPSKKQVVDGDGKPFHGLADPNKARSSAWAAADVALVQLRLGDKESALANLTKALDLVRATTPSPVATQAAVDECTRQVQSVRADLASQLRLGSDSSRIDRAFNSYRKQCNAIDQMADDRLTLQAIVLQAFAKEGLLTEVWQLVKDRNRSDDSGTGEPYHETGLPVYLRAAAVATGNSGLAEEIKSGLAGRTSASDPINELNAEVDGLLASGRSDDAASAIQKRYRDPIAKKEPDRLDRVALRAASRVQATSASTAAAQFVKNLFDEPAKEDAWLLLGGYSMRQGKGPELWKLTADDPNIPPLEVVSLFRGLIGGAPQDGGDSVSAKVP